MIDIETDTHLFITAGVQTHNCKLYDIPYLVNRVGRLLGEAAVKKFSPWGVVNERMIKFSGKEEQSYEIYGLEQLDYLDLFKKFGYTFGTQASYSLDHIANLVLGEKKLDYTDYGNLRNLYNENPQLHTEYCIKDTMLVVRMDKTLAFMGTLFVMSYMMRVNYSDSLGTTASWDSYLYGEYHKRGICVPPKKFKYGDSDDQVDGAYVKEPKPGLYDWVVSMDVTSEYPSIIMQNNISPETIAGRIEGVTALSLLAGRYPEIPDNHCLTATGQMFRTDVAGVLPQLVDGIFNNRKRAKKEMFKQKELLHRVEVEIEKRKGTA